MSISLPSCSCAKLAHLLVFGRVPFHGLDNAACRHASLFAQFAALKALGLGDQAGAAFVREAVDAIDGLGQFGEVRAASLE